MIAETDNRTRPIRDNVTGYCIPCDKVTVSLHKCPDCGKYVQRPCGSNRELALELIRGKRKIRNKYRTERDAAYDAKDMEAISRIKKKVRAEIAAYLSQGKPEEKIVDDGTTFPLVDKSWQK